MIYNKARERLKQLVLENPGSYFVYYSYTQTVVDVINTSGPNVILEE